MYTPPAFQLDDRTALEVMRSNSFAMVVTGGIHGVMVTHAPVVVRGERLLEFHLAKPNPQCAALREGGEVLVVFQGPHAYISPAWYGPGPAVPTWNYVAVHVYGKTRVLEGDELRRHLEELVRTNEEAAGTGWKLSDAPEQYLAGLSRGIVGFEVKIERLEGKAKMSQNRDEIDDIPGIIRGLRATGKPHDAEVAAWMEKQQ
jgi:transcriptional regulator